MLYPKNTEAKLSPELFANPTCEYRGTPFWAWNGKLSREELTSLLSECRAVCAEAMLLPYGREAAESHREMAAFLAKNLTKNQIMRTIELLQKYHGDCAFNVGIGHVLGALAVELEGIL